MQLEDIKPDTVLRGLVPDAQVSVVSVRWHGSNAMSVVFREPSGKVEEQLLYRDDESRLEVSQQGRPWSFDGDGALFRLVSEARRIELAHLFDPLLAVHSSLIDPLPHQITAVYEAMLPRQPLRFLLADDPGAGKTIMAGLLIKELMARGDLQRCLVVCPGNLAEQWQDELSSKFNLPFEILTNEGLRTARSGNWFSENDLAIARLDKLARDEETQAKLLSNDCSYDLVVCDEAHKLSATFFGNEIKYTKRYHLGQKLSTITRHFLLMTATPHNGKEADFQLFLALLDGDRFEGKFRDGVHHVDVSDLMRRMVKEQLVKFDGRPLFPERIAKTVPYRLSDGEARLYKAVTDYVREEFNRADSLDDKRKGNIGFALTILQRRLASSPEAIYRSLERRRKRLEKRMREVELDQRAQLLDTPLLGEEELEDLEDAPETEWEQTEKEIFDSATASRTIFELKQEIAHLQRLEKLALDVRQSGHDTKWRELAGLLQQIFTPQAILGRVEENQTGLGARTPTASPHQKLVVFTEHRDTLHYLHQRINTLLGQQTASVLIHGAMGREERRKAQETFLHNPEVKILLATDAAGEGINLQRAHLMINYDLPWNPNRLEQRFGRIHRIGQSEVCYLWNLVADETREGDVYRRLLEKLEQAREALGGQVFDVLGKLQFEGKPLKNLLIEAIRYGDSPEVRQRLERAIEKAVDREHLNQLLEEKALVHETMNSERLFHLREQMERAQARKLQPHYIQSFFLEGFKRLGGTLYPRESQRFEVTHVPSAMRNRDRQVGNGPPLLKKYERITFQKERVTLPGKPLAAFICPGHPLLQVCIDLLLERHRDLLKRGSVLVDPQDTSTTPRVLFALEHAIEDDVRVSTGKKRTVSRQLLYVEMTPDGALRFLQAAPYLDYRPLGPEEPDISQCLARPELEWVNASLESQVQDFAIENVVPRHFEEVRSRRLDQVEKSRNAIKQRLTREIAYWDHRAVELQERENAGKPSARLPASEARRRADEMHTRLKQRMAQLDRESRLYPTPPVVLEGTLVLPIGLVQHISGTQSQNTSSIDTQLSAARARAVVMDIERNLGFEPIDRELDRVGYDIESRDPQSGHLRFIEVKGRVAGARTLTVTRNEVLTSLNQPERYILAMVEFCDDHTHRVHYLRHPFRCEPDFGATSVNYDFSELIARSEEPT